MRARNLGEIHLLAANINLQSPKQRNARATDYFHEFYDTRCRYMYFRVNYVSAYPTFLLFFVVEYF